MLKLSVFLGHLPPSQGEPVFIILVVLTWPVTAEEYFRAAFFNNLFCILTFVYFQKL